MRAAVAHAIKSGYKHIDAAYVYGNEEEVGEGIKEGLATTNISRSDLFIVTKLWCTYHTRVEQNLDISLKLLGLDYVDLYLMRESSMVRKTLPFLTCLFHYFRCTKTCTS